MFTVAAPFRAVFAHFLPAASGFLLKERAQLVKKFKVHFHARENIAVDLTARSRTENLVHRVTEVDIHLALDLRKGKRIFSAVFYAIG